MNRDIAHCNYLSPEIFPDELLYSFCARYSDYTKYGNKRLAIRDLFGTSNITPVVDLPSHLGDFLQQNRRHGPSSDQLIDLHTLLPYYSAFMPRERVQQLRSDMVGRNGNSIHVRAGIAASRVRLPDRLRYCPLCIHADLKTSGEPYWHRNHQLPGIVVCPTHGADLVDSVVKIQGASKRYGYVSASRSLPTRPEIFYYRVVEFRYFELIAQDAAWLLEHANIANEPSQLRVRYLTLLEGTSYVTRRGNIRIQRLIDSFRRFCPPEVIQTIGYMSPDPYAWLPRIFQESEHVQHPIFHLLLVRFLSQSIKSFMEDETVRPPFGTGPWPCLNMAGDHYGIDTILDCEITYVHGRPKGTFKCSCGFSYARIGPDRSDDDRLRVDLVCSYGSTWDRRLKELCASSDMSLRAISRILAADPMTIKRAVQRLRLSLPHMERSARDLDLADLFYREPPVQVQERDSNRELRESHRQKWLETLTRHSEKGITAIRLEIPVTYTWLYRNDREWLVDNRPQSQKRRLQSQMTVNWQERDEHVAAAVCSAAIQLRSAENRPIQLTKASLGRESGYYSLVHKKLERLPKTAACLEELVETREQYAVRRIVWAAEFCRKEGISPKKWQLARIAGVDRVRGVRSVEEALSAFAIY